MCGKFFSSPRATHNQNQPNNMNLKNCKILGYFSMPSPQMAEHNPAAYSLAMANMPTNSGCCAHCGTGIIHHVMVRTEDGNTAFIGTSCAEKVGADPVALRSRISTAERERREAARVAAMEKWDAEQQAKREAAERAKYARLEHVGWVVDMLREFGSDFHKSLAAQLETRPLTGNQAYYVAKATSPTGRRNKKNASAWDAVIDLCMADFPPTKNN